MLTHRLIAKFCLSVSLCFAGCHQPTHAQAPPTSSPRVLTRVFFQDEDAQTVKWADVLWGQPPTLGPVHAVAGFPKLDRERQSLVQMRSNHGMVLVGVRDDAAGAFSSGWVLIDSGVRQQSHGDHAHWAYPTAPRIRAIALDDQQGNPAHVYDYEHVFFVANDRRNGYTRLDPAKINDSDDPAQIRRLAGFHQGGGNHITLAVSGNFGFSAWIDREGENRGRVDVTSITPTGNQQIAHTFQLPSGGIHGAATCQGKVFLAPSDGISWIDVRHAPEIKASAIHHLSLGKRDEIPRRTGAFATLGRYVAFVAGSGDDATLGLIDASSATPAVFQLPLQVAAGNKPAGLTLAVSRGGKPLAFVFHDHEPSVDAPDSLSVVELDPNADRDYRDAKVAAVVPVGRARVAGHSGHHSLALDAEGRRAIMANPGDGTLAVLQLADWKIEQEVKVGGAPCSILCVGGRQETD